MKPIRITKHAKEQCLERGATEIEVRHAIEYGSREPAKHGRELCRYNFPFDQTWQGTYYRIKQVAPVIKEEADEVVVITIHVFLLKVERHGMKISYDPEVDALYIRLLEGNYECRTVRLNDEVALNIGPGEVLVGIEILDAKQVFGSNEVPPLSLENIRLAASVQ